MSDDEPACMRRIGRAVDLLRLEAEGESVWPPSAPKPAAASTPPGDAEVRVPEAMPVAVPEIRPPTRDETLVPATANKGRHGLMAALIVGALICTVGWHFATPPRSCRVPDPHLIDSAGVVARIVTAESNGDATAKNKRSTATGAGQFLDGTWLDMIRIHRPDLAGRTETEILDLRYDPDLSREMVARYAERNAAMLASRCLPVTPGTVYLAHFAGAGGAMAVLSAPENADAAATMAKADSTGRTTRARIVKANPFLESLSVADLKVWADRKMRTAGHP